MNWILQLLSHNLAFLFHLISLGKLTSIPLLNMHLKSSVSSPEPAGFSHLLTFYLYTSPKSVLLYSTAPTSGVVLQNLLCLLDKVQSKAIRLINNPNLTKSLQPLSHRRLVGDLSIFYKYFHGHCSQEIREIIPVSLRRVRTTRSSTHSHPFQVSLPNPRTLSHKTSFIPRTCNLWNVLPSSCFPESYNLPSFKSKINKLDLISLSPLSHSLSSFFLC